jgi:hypothetical protein
MKTWEMIKELSENPKLKFNNGIHKVKISDITKRIVWAYADEKEEPFIIFSNAPGAVDNLHIEWELIPQEVPWQEALQAWLDGKTVSCRVEACDNQVNLATRYIHYGDSNETRYPLGKVEFTKGKWYID